MTRHMGASFALSYLIVGIVAIVLYQPDHARPHRPSNQPVAKNETPPARPREPLPEVTPALPLIEATPIVETMTSRRPAWTAPDVDVPTSRPTAMASTANLDDSPRPIPPSRLQPISHRRVPREPRSAFTQVDEGESLADVALRVYGTPDAAQSL